MFSPILLIFQLIILCSVFFFFKFVSNYFKNISALFKASNSINICANKQKHNFLLLNF